MNEEERARRSLVDQVRQQQAQIGQLQQELTQRHVDTATAAIRGLETLVALAAAGNAPARLALKALLDSLEAARTAMAGLVVTRS